MPDTTPTTDRVAQLEAQLAEYEVMNPQQCPKGLHADWLVDSEHTHACPWCRIAELKAELPTRQVLGTTDQQPETTPAATCSAEYHGDEDGARLCIRAAQHTGTAHTDERGYHWSDTLAVYPLADGTFRTGVNLRAAVRRMADEAQQPETEAFDYPRDPDAELILADLPPEVQRSIRAQLAADARADQPDTETEAAK